MNWSDIADVVGKAAPMIGSALGGPAGGAVGGLVSSALGTDNNPDAVAEAMQSDPEAAAKIKQLEQENQRKLREMTLEAETQRMTQINKTMRDELKSDNAFRASWRPLFGYGAAIAWVGQIAAVIYVAIWNPENAGDITKAIGSLTGMWGIALSVLGININARSKDKKLQAGQDSRGGMEKIIDRFTGNG